MAKVKVSPQRLANQPAWWRKRTRDELLVIMLDQQDEIAKLRREMSKVSATLGNILARAEKLREDARSDVAAEMEKFEKRIEELEDLTSTEDMMDERELMLTALGMTENEWALEGEARARCADALRAQSYRSSAP